MDGHGMVSSSAGSFTQARRFARTVLAGSFDLVLTFEGRGSPGCNSTLKDCHYFAAQMPALAAVTMPLRHVR
jgi:hypothetical protein